MNSLLVIDMQVGCFRTPTERHDTDGVVERINALAGAMRDSGGLVVFIQHDGLPVTPLNPIRPTGSFCPS